MNCGVKTRTLFLRVCELYASRPLETKGTHPTVELTDCIVWHGKQENIPTK